MPMHPSRLVTVLACTLAAALLLRAAPRAQAAAAPPRLYVIVSVDQLRGDYVTRYGGAWTRGLRRLVDGGAQFPLASYPYMNTVTCPGHATIGTGAFPATHGMVLNQWHDRTSQKNVQCTEDATVQPITYSGAPSVSGRPGNSAANLLVPTFADELRAQSGTPPRLASFSGKARAAIGMIGHRGDVVMWLDGERGWSTSTAFASAPHPGLQAFIAANPVANDYGTSWTKLLPEHRYQFADDGLGEGRPNGWTSTFPHAVESASGTPDAQFMSRWENTPFADAYLTKLAIRAVDELHLGQDPARRDVLAVSYSVLDHVGHAYGPRSHEVQDVLARLDVTLGDLLDALDRQVGREHYVLAFTGDHGVSPIPEQMSAEGLAAGRIPLAEVRARVERALEPHLGPGPHTATLVYTDLYFLPGRYERLVAQPDAMRAAIQALLDSPGIARVYRSDMIEAGIVPEDGFGKAVAKSYLRGRSGDLLIVPDVYHITSGAIATHGTGYAYDARVPVILFGWKVRSGSYPVVASPADIAPTFAFIAGITLPRADGRPLVEALLPGAVPGPMPLPTARR